LLTDEEREAVEVLRVRKHKQQNNNEEEKKDDEDDVNSRMARVNKHQKRDVEKGEECTNSDFILGSAAEIERVWSHGDLILKKSRRNMSRPILFETLLFLKVNRLYWDVSTVAAASRAIKEDRAFQRLEHERISQENNDSDME
jgi:hypothetical protein